MGVVTSMTGFGSSSQSLGGWTVRVDCRGVNHRGLDFRLYVPSELRWVEEELSRKVQSLFSRGRIELRIEVKEKSSNGSDHFEGIDDRRFALVAQKLSALAESHGLGTPVSVDAVLHFEDFLRPSSSDALGPDQKEAIFAVIEEALDSFTASRRTEGAGIVADLCGHLEAIKANVEKVALLREGGRETLKLRTEERIRKVLADFEVQELDESRLLQELALFVERGDIAEELQRANAHIENLFEILQTPEAGGVGKKIDFYLQEMIRETNTMGSKSQDSELSTLVIEMKSRIEKMREQAANIE